VVIVAIDQQDIEAVARETLGGVQPAEPRADDNHTYSVISHGHTIHKSYTSSNAINVSSTQRKASSYTVRQNSSRPSHHQIRFANGRTV